MDTISEQVLRLKLGTLENRRLDVNLAIADRMLEAVKNGISIEGKHTDLSGKKERYLEALSCYQPWGLTPEELYEKRQVWLWHPGEPEVLRVKTVSLFLLRLKRDGLASRIRESHSWRYFIKKDGIKRLEFYIEKRKPEEEKARLLGLLW